MVAVTQPSKEPLQSRSCDGLLPVRSSLDSQLPGLSKAEVAIFFARPEEAGGIEDCMKRSEVHQGQRLRVSLGTVSEVPVAVMYPWKCPPDLLEAAEIARRTWSPKWWISAGFAGALNEDLRRGQILLVTEVLDLPSQEAWCGAWTDLPAPIWQWLVEQGVKPGKLIVVGGRPTRLEDKKHLREHFLGDLYECGTKGLTQWARTQYPRSLMIRIITEEAEEVPSPDIRWIQSQTSWAGKAGAILGTIFRRKTGIRTLWESFERNLAATDKLASLLAQLVVQLSHLKTP